MLDLKSGESELQPCAGTRRSAVRWAVAMAFGFALLMATWGCSKPVSQHGDIVLITVDTLRPDHLGLYGYARDTSPNLERFFEDGAIFRNAYATEAKTPPSIVSILSGRSPQRHRVRMFYQLLPETTPLVTDLLPEIYQSAAFVSSTPLTHDAIGLGERFGHYDDFVDERESDRLMFERNARRTTDAVLDWFREERDPGRPSFLFIHYIDPHGPYAPPPDSDADFEHEGTLPIDPGRVKDYMRLEEPAARDGHEYVDRYDEEIAYMDREVGRLLDALASMIDLDSALVILTSDHGESMMDHEEWFRHGYHVYEELVRVPLAIRGPGVSRGAREGLASGVDITPTVLGFAGAAIPEDLEGIDLRTAASGAQDRSVMFEATAGKGQWKALVRARRKWMAYHEGQPGIAPTVRRYYDLDRDPDELHPGEWAPADEETSHLLRRFEDDPDPGGRPRDFVKGARTETPRISPRADDEDLERLRALGYVD